MEGEFAVSLVYQHLSLVFLHAYMRLYHLLLFNIHSTAEGNATTRGGGAALQPRAPLADYLVIIWSIMNLSSVYPKHLFGADSVNIWLLFDLFSESVWRIFKLMPSDGERSHGAGLEFCSNILDACMHHI